MIMKLSKIFLVSILSVFLLVGCTQSNNPKPGTPTETPTEKPGETPKPNETPTPGNGANADYSSEINLSIVDVYDKFLAEFDGVQLYNIELSLKQKGYVYELEGFDATDQHEVEYDAISGETIKYEKDTKDDTKVPLAKEDLNLIQNLFDLSHEDAGVDYRLDEWSLKVKDGIKVFEIELKDASRHEIEYRYNLDTGELLRKK